jgi:hypothetical protein
MNAPIVIAPVRKSVRVKAPVARARKDFLPAIALKSPLSGRVMGVLQIAQ